MHKKWIAKWINSNEFLPGDISFMFTDNPGIRSVNRAYLNHDYFTDVITFDYAEFPVISGDIIVSIDEVRENALVFKTEFEDELRRVMIHGIIHLFGFNDSNDEERAIMREKENEALHLWKIVVQDEGTV